MLFPRMVCKIPEVLLRRSLANSRDTSCHRSVIAATRHPGILAAWISPDYTLNQYGEENDVLIILVHHTYCEDKNSHFQLLPSFDFRKSQCKTSSSLAYFFHLVVFPDYFMNASCELHIMQNECQPLEEEFEMLHFSIHTTIFV